MFVPAGTSPTPVMPRWNVPVSSVFVKTIGSPESSDVPVFGSHGSQLGPSLMSASALFGTYTVML